MMKVFAMAGVAVSAAASRAAAAPFLSCIEIIGSVLDALLG
jgi:hypothetical protein